MQYSTSYYGRLKRYWYDALYVQCIFSIIWFPVGAYWGMGSAFLSIIGNVLFGCIVHGFLWLSSLIFFSNVIGIPCGLLTTLLTLLSKLWLYCMSYAPHNAMLHTCQPSLFYLSILLCSFILIMHSRLLRNYQPVCLLVLLSSMIGSFYTSSINIPVVDNLSFLKKNVTLVHSKNVTCLIDQGALGSSVNSPAHLEYNFLPMFYKKYASKKINHCIVLHPSLMTFNTLIALCQLEMIDNLYVPYWKNNDQSPVKNKKLYRAFYQLKRSIEQQGGRLHRLAKEHVEIILDAQHILSIHPTDKLINKNDFTTHLFAYSLKALKQ